MQGGSSHDEQIAASGDEPMEKLLDSPVAFGLRAQGHIPMIRRMLAEGRTWESIGREIGWDPDTAMRHYCVLEADNADA